MSNPYFDESPHLELLRWLARGSLKQNLNRGIRLWVWLQLLYGDYSDSMELNLPFTYTQWRDNFFSATHPQGEKTPHLHDDNCPCAKTVSEWLHFESNLSETKWKKQLQDHDGLSEQELEQVLKKRLFGVTRRSLLNDLHTLNELGWLERDGQNYYLVREFPDYPKKLPTPDYIQSEIYEAWRLDFYLPKQLMLLRFEEQFNQQYIQDTYHHYTFKKLSYQQAVKLIKQETKPYEQKELLAILQSRSQMDAYYQVMYQDGDVNVLHRLRSWRPNVEVLLPWKMRQSISYEVQTETELYPLKSTRFVGALGYATQLHQNQTRKDGKTPYIAHLLAVASLVLEDGGDEDEAIAALFHDALEDQGGAETEAKIRQRFGDKVTAIVKGCTESETIPKPPWKERKQRYLEQMKQGTTSVLRVSIADKLHNARSLLTQLRVHGDITWSLFHGGKEGTLWFYRSLLEIYQQKLETPMLTELEQIINQLEKASSVVDIQ